MGIQVQPNCCKDYIYLNQTKLSGFTGYYAKDKVWQAASTVSRCADGYCYYSQSATKNVTRIDAGRGTNPVVIGTVSTSRTLGPVRLANDDSRLAFMRSASFGVGAGFELIAMSLNDGTQITLENVTVASFPGSGPVSPFVNVSQQKLGWLLGSGGFSSPCDFAIKTADYDGSGTATVATLTDNSGFVGINGGGSSVAVDHIGQRYFFAWTKTAPTNAIDVKNHGTIRSVNWDGSGFAEVFSIFSSLYPSEDPDSFLSARIYDLQLHKREQRLYYLLANSRPGTVPADQHMGIRSIKLDGTDDRLDWHASELPHPNDAGKSTGARFSGSFQLGEGLIKIDQYY